MILASDFKVAWLCAHITGCLFGPASTAARGGGATEVVRTLDSGQGRIACGIQSTQA
jgi:hypothetical protein